MAWVADSAQLDGLRKVARTGVAWFDIPATQLALSGLLLEEDPDPARRAAAHEGRGLALLALGRPAAALREIDSAAALLGSAEARLEAAEWRAILPVLGLPAANEAGDTTSRGVLETLVVDPEFGARAAWALALGSGAAGDSAAARQWGERLDPDSPRGAALAGLARALEEAGRGRPEQALRISDSLRRHFNVTHPPDPFAGAVFHLLRGDWLLSQGHPARADREWLWYEGGDFDGWPAGPAQAGEIDGALGVYARLKRGAAGMASARSAADSSAACGWITRVTELWREAEPVMKPLVARADSLARSCP
jgi:hypothetical protein